MGVIVDVNDFYFRDSYIINEANNLSLIMHDKHQLLYLLSIIKNLQTINNKFH